MWTAKDVGVKVAETRSAGNCAPAAAEIGSVRHAISSSSYEFGETLVVPEVGQVSEVVSAFTGEAMVLRSQDWDARKCRRVQELAYMLAQWERRMGVSLSDAR